MKTISQLLGIPSKMTPAEQHICDILSGVMGRNVGTTRTGYCDGFRCFDRNEEDIR